MLNNAVACGADWWLSATTTIVTDGVLVLAGAALVKYIFVAAPNRIISA